MGLNEKREVNSKKVVTLEEFIDGVDTYVTKVIDNELIAVLTRMFKAQVETT